MTGTRTQVAETLRSGIPRILRDSLRTLSEPVGLAPLAIYQGLDADHWAALLDVKKSAPQGESDKNEWEPKISVPYSRQCATAAAAQNKASSLPDGPDTNAPKGMSALPVPMGKLMPQRSKKLPREVFLKVRRFI